MENKKSKGMYTFSEPQVSSILELRLQKLTALGINEIEVEIKKLNKQFRLNQKPIKIDIK